MTKYQINIENNNRKEIVIEDYNSIKKDIDNHSDEDHETFFCEEYYKAHLILQKITKNGNVKDNESCNKEYDCKNYEKNKKDNYSEVKNNIIIFSGDRGSGKTSAMFSFGKYLENDVEKGNENKKRTCHYKLLEMIDPSYFRKNESILLNIITVMFKMAKSFIEEGKNNEEHDNKTSEFKDLLRDFEKVFKSVNKMDSVIPEENSLEYLNELSSSINLKESIYKLIKKFLKLFNEKHEYLVIMIDDLDMNISHASNMLEQIRKFLIHKNIIILLATNIDQLQFEIKESYSKYYEKILHPMQNQPSVSVDVDDMATKYLLKLFPPLQRVHIGNAANKLINTNLKIENDKDKTIDDDLQRVILNLIWKKTRLLFINEDDQLHPIIPTNLRALHQLIYMLIEMEDVKTLYIEKKDGNGEIIKDKNNETIIEKAGLFKNKEEYEISKYNFNKFKDYILNIWIPSNVSFDEKKVFDNIPKDIRRINKHFIQSINVIGSKYKKTILIKDIDFEKYLEEKGKNYIFDRDIYTFVSPNDPRFSVANKISDIYNYPSNNTVGDILLLIDKYKTYFEATNQTKFIEAVKIYYTLLLFETMFFPSNENKENKEIKSISSIQRLIGGTFFFPHYFNIIKSLKYDESKKTTDEDSLIESIIKKIKDIKTKGVKIKKNDKDINLICENIKQELIKQIKIKKPFTDEKKSISILENIFRDSITNINNALNITDSDNTIRKKIQEIIDNVMFYVLEEIKNKKAENHLYYNLIANEKNVFDLIFFILYYGGSRPERSSGEHIYDTKKDINNKADYRFDILSLLVNTLNPLQTLSRFYDNINCESLYEETDFKKSFKTIKDGSETNKLAEWLIHNTFDNLNIQNFILPIYSVDLLLEYLRKTYDISELKITVTDSKNPTKYHEKMREKLSIYYYYEELNKLTQVALSKIETKKKEENIDNTDLSEIALLYNKIFESGRDTFILTKTEAKARERTETETKVENNNRIPNE